MNIQPINMQGIAVQPERNNKAVNFGSIYKFELIAANKEKNLQLAKLIESSIRDAQHEHKFKLLPARIASDLKSIYISCENAADEILDFAAQGFIDVAKKLNLAQERIVVKKELDFFTPENKNLNFMDVENIYKNSSLPEIEVK